MSPNDISVETVQFLTVDGRFEPNKAAEEFGVFVDKLTTDDVTTFYRNMTLMRRFDEEAARLQRQGHLALWVPSNGQEAAQMGSVFATKKQDHIFPSYREHIVGMFRGIDVIDILRLLRGHTLGGWSPEDCGNFHLYTLVLASQTLHATGYAMGVTLDGKVGTGDDSQDEAVLVYYGDGATSQGDASEALVFASSYQTPQVFFVQNNQWAISVPVSRQSRSPLVLRGIGFGMPSTQIDGNDVFASFAVSKKYLDDARSGKGPAFIEAVTYRMGAHTTADDPTKYRTDTEVASWLAKDPIVRLRKYLERLDVGEDYFAEIAREAEDFASDTRKRTLSLVPPGTETIFPHVYSEAHPLIDEQKAWFESYEASFEGEGS